MIEGMQRALDVSFLETVLVPINGKEYALRPQSAPQLELILNAIFASSMGEFTQEDEASKEIPWGTFLRTSFEESLPIIAMMFGYVPDTVEAVEFVKELHVSLPPRLASRIYEEWRRVNDIDDFLFRLGKPLLEPELVERMKEARHARVEKLIEEGKQELQEILETPAT